MATSPLHLVGQNHQPVTREVRIAAEALSDAVFVNIDEADRAAMAEAVALGMFKAGWKEFSRADYALAAGSFLSSTAEVGTSVGLDGCLRTPDATLPERHCCVPDDWQ